MTAPRLPALLLLCATGSTPVAQSIVHEWRSDPIPPDTYFGYRLSIGSVGDLDGDGVPDVVIGEPLAGPGSIFDRPGRFRAYSGRAGTHLYTVDGPPGRLNLGWFIAPLDDLDQDGTADFAVWNATATASAWIACSGRDGSTIRTWNGVTSVCRGPDADGDGIADVLLTDDTWMSSTSGGFPLGRAELRSGRTDALIHTFVGLSNSEPLGRAIPVGDVDGDGHDDICFGHGGHPSHGGGSSGVSLHSGQPPFALLHRIRAPRPSDSFGHGAVGPGDVDGDGCADVAIFDPRSRLAFDDTKVFVYSGRTAAILHVWGPPNTSSGYGSWLGAPGDVDGDGHADVAIYTTDPNPSGEIIVRSGRDGTQLVGLATRLLFFGAGDLDGDDFPELLVSNWEPRNTVPFRRVRAWSLRSQGIDVLGRGCEPNGSAVPRIGASRTPAIGKTFEVHVSRSEPRRAAWLLIGASSTRWGGASLPLDLGLFGHPGCALLTSIDAVCQTTTSGVPGNGHATLGLPIPNQPALRGVRFFLQWVLPDPPGLVMSRALSCTVR